MCAHGAAVRGERAAGTRPMGHAFFCRREGGRMNGGAEGKTEREDTWTKRERVRERDPICVKLNGMQ